MVYIFLDPHCEKWNIHNHNHILCLSANPLVLLHMSRRTQIQTLGSWIWRNILNLASGEIFINTNLDLKIIIKFYHNFNVFFCKKSIAVSHVRDILRRRKAAIYQWSQDLYCLTNILIMLKSSELLKISDKFIWKKKIVMENFLAFP